MVFAFAGPQTCAETDQFAPAANASTTVADAGTEVETTPLVVFRSVGGIVGATAVRTRVPFADVVVNVNS
jgi:hypothetical protein